MDDKQIFELVSELAGDQFAAVVGGYVRDLILGIPNDDIDIVVVGDALGVAEKFAQRIGGKVQIFKTYGTAKVDCSGKEIEFVMARSESYDRNSRKPQTQPGTLEDDLKRRDLTVNALALDLKTGNIVDMFGGRKNLEEKILRTPIDPDVTFYDDPLRMLRVVRFAVKLGFTIDQNTFDGIKKNASRLEIISAERINVELNKILMSSQPGRGIMLLSQTGLLPYILPEVEALGNTGNEGHHKNNFLHSVKVLDQVAEKSNNLWLRWAALLHDIGKEPTKHYDEERGWTFWDHERVGAAMVEPIFRRLKLPLGPEKDFVTNMVFNHMRPSMISTREITDSAVRRLVFDANGHIEDLMLLASCDLTTGNAEKRARLEKHYIRLQEMIDDLLVRDQKRLFKPVINGLVVMELTGLPQGYEVGKVIAAMKEDILDGKVENDENSLITWVKENWKKYV